MVTFFGIHLLIVPKKNAWYFFFGKLTKLIVAIYNMKHMIMMVQIQSNYDKAGQNESPKAKNSKARKNGISLYYDTIYPY